MPARLPPRMPLTPPSPHALVALHRSRKKPTDAVALLKADHQHVAALFERYSRLGPADIETKRAVCAAIRDELEQHSRLEEQSFYPVLAKTVSREVKALVREAEEEHAIIERLVAELALLDPEDEELDAKLSVLRKTVEGHVQEEETRIFPAARRWLGEAKLLDLAQEMTRTRQALRRGITGTVTDAAGGAVNGVSEIVGAAVRGFRRGLQAGRGPSSRQPGRGKSRVPARSGGTRRRNR